MVCMMSSSGMMQIRTGLHTPARMPRPTPMSEDSTVEANTSASVTDGGCPEADIPKQSESEADA